MKDKDLIAALTVKTVQLKISVREEEALARKRKELTRRWPGSVLSDTALCRYLIHAGLGLLPPRQGEDDDSTKVRKAPG